MTNRYSGLIGFLEENVEVEPDVYGEAIVEHHYYGEVRRNTQRYSINDSINGTISIDNEISIIADPYATNNIANMRYITWMGKKWIIKTVQVNAPRLILSIGGLYNGEQN